METNICFPTIWLKHVDTLRQHKSERVLSLVCADCKQKAAVLQILGTGIRIMRW